MLAHSPLSGEEAPRSTRFSRLWREPPAGRQVRALRLLIERCGESRLRLEAAARDSAGRTALEIATVNRKPAMVELLRGAMARTDRSNATERNGRR